MNVTDTTRCCPVECKKEEEVEEEQPPEIGERTCEDWVDSGKCVEGTVEFRRACTDYNELGDEITEIEIKYVHIAGRCVPPVPTGGEETPEEESPSIPTGFFGFGTTADIGVGVGLLILIAFGAYSFVFFARKKLIK
jgi:hypothetical protein